MTWVQKAKSPKWQYAGAGGACGASEHIRAGGACGASEHIRAGGHKSITCPQRGDLPRKERKEAKCSNWGVGGHRKNTCNKPKVVMHVVETGTLQQQQLCK